MYSKGCCDPCGTYKGCNPCGNYKNCNPCDTNKNCCTWSDCFKPQQSCPKPSYCIISSVSSPTPSVQDNSRSKSRGRIKSSNDNKRSLKSRPASAESKSQRASRSKNKTKNKNEEEGEGSVRSSINSKGSVISWSKNIISRPSSADSAKAAPTGKGSLRSFSKSTSDSKVAKNRSSTKQRKNGEVKSKIDPQTVQLLKDDLHTIKDQLLLLANNRNNALELTNELQARYTDLLKKNQEQETEINLLKQQNKDLSMKLQNQRIGEGPHVEEVLETKKNLDQYESKLNTLYSELLSSSKILENNRESVCRCIEEKNQKLQNVLSSTKRLSQSLEEKNEEYEKLKKSYNKVKENEEKWMKEKADLTLTVKELEDKLNRSAREIEILKNDSAVAVMKKDAEIQKITNCFCCQLQVKSQEIDQLSSQVKLLEDENGNNKNLESEYKKLKTDYDQALRQMKIYQDNDKQRFQELQKLQTNEKKILAQVTKLQNFTNEQSEINKKQRMTITQLENMNEEQESAIQRLRADVASKEKQIEILIQSEDRLKKRTIDLREEMVSMKMCHCNQKNVLTTDGIDESPVNLAEEIQDLINALYEEIDKTMTKDEQIQHLSRRVCHLEQSLLGKEKELVGVSNHLKILREQFTSTLNEKPMLAGRMNQQRPLEKVCEAEECDCQVCR